MEILSHNDVIAVLKHDEARFTSGDTFKVQQLLKEYENYIRESVENSDNSDIFTQGIECEVIRQDGTTKGWRKGKINLVIKFEPEETSNNTTSLDDIRSRIHTSD
ncbi:hypothetical protein NIES4102_11400 [Chondrocystis sp. NIES-4102]|nr:hypothetical protein NIES4102_11400 [Chondrocystis sp. NIES-4102]